MTLGKICYLTRQIIKDIEKFADFLNPPKFPAQPNKLVDELNNTNFVISFDVTWSFLF